MPETTTPKYLAYEAHFRPVLLGRPARVARLIVVLVYLSQHPRLVKLREELVEGAIPGLLDARRRRVAILPIVGGQLRSWYVCLYRLY